MGKRKPPAEEGAPLWMCTYGDLMSLLLCFFIMLFALSIIAEVRFQAIADTLSQEFTGHAASSTTKAPSTKTITTPADSAAKSKRISAQMGGQPKKGPKGDQTTVHTILLDGETVSVIRFELGSYELTEQAESDLQAVFPSLRGSPQKIMVKGYTAPTEREAARRADDLAFNRALNVVDYFVTTLGLKQDAFEIVADPAAAPRLNRLPPGTDPQLAGASVEIIILDQTYRSLRE